jgi:hypothetical protein
MFSGSDDVRSGAKSIVKIGTDHNMKNRMADPEKS